MIQLLIIALTLLVAIFYDRIVYPWRVRRAFKRSFALICNISTDLEAFGVAMSGAAVVVEKFGAALKANELLNSKGVAK